MPDMKTAMAEALARRSEPPVEIKKILDEWEADEQRIRTQQPQTSTQPQQENTVPNPNPIPTFTVTNNVMRATFNYIRDNKDQTRKSTVAGLMKQGYKESSVSAVVSQLMRSKQVHKNFDGTLHAVTKEYVPVKAVSKPKHPPAQISDKLKEKISVMKRKTDTKQGIAALKAVTTEQPKPVVKAWTPDDVVNSLNVVQARQLYDYLKNVFGGYTL